MLANCKLGRLFASSSNFASQMFASGRWYPQPSDEPSRHRSRPPQFGMTRRARVLVVDNSELGREATTSGRLAYLIWVYRHGYRAKHMPKAHLGDKILVAIRGEMRRALVLGENIHPHYRKHGVPSTDTNMVALLDSDENPVGNRIIAPIPAALLRKRDNLAMSKVLALATKYF